MLHHFIPNFISCFIGSGPRPVSILYMPTPRGKLKNREEREKVKVEWEKKVTFHFNGPFFNFPVTIWAFFLFLLLRHNSKTWFTFSMSSSLIIQRRKLKICICFPSTTFFIKKSRAKDSSWVLKTKNYPIFLYKSLRPDHRGLRGVGEENIC